MTSLERAVKHTLPKLKQQYFVSSYQTQATDSETLGILVAHLMDWDGRQILDVAAKALEDANYHAACAVVDEMHY